MSILATVPAAQTVSVSAELDVAPDRAYAAFLDPLLLAGWYGPQGWSVPVHTVSVDPRPGGTLRLGMVHHTGQGNTAPGQLVPLYSTFVSLVPGELIEHRESLPGPNGEASDALVYHRIEFLPRDAADQDGDGAEGTRVVVSLGPLPPEVHDSVAEGWHSALRKLREVVEAEARADRPVRR